MKARGFAFSWVKSFSPDKKQFFTIRDRNFQSASTFHSSGEFEVIIGYSRVLTLKVPTDIKDFTG